MACFTTGVEGGAGGGGGGRAALSRRYMSSWPFPPFRYSAEDGCEVVGLNWLMED